MNLLKPWKSLKDLWNKPVKGMDYPFPQYEQPMMWYRECPYKVFIPYYVWQEMHYFVKNCATEMGGHLEIEKKGDNLVIKRLHIPTQEVTGASYVPNAKGMIEITKNDPKLISRIKGWFHSHAGSPTHWSSIDEECISNNVQVFRDYCVSIVMNKMGEYRIRLDTATESYDQLPLYILLAEKTECEEYCKRELAKKVKKEPPVKAFVNNFATIFTRKRGRKIETPQKMQTKKHLRQSRMQCPLAT